MKNIKPTISTTIILIWCLLFPIIGKSENNTVLRYDKIVFSAIQRGPEKDKPHKYVIVNSDRSTIISMHGFEKSTSNCYTNTIQQGIVNEAIFKKIAALLKNIDAHSWKRIHPQLDADRAASFTEYNFLFLQNGVIKYAVSTYDHSFSADLRKLSLLFEAIDSNMRITKPKPFASIDGLVESTSFVPLFISTMDNGIVDESQKGIMLSYTECYLLWNYVRKASIVSTIDEPLPFHFDYQPLDICQNGVSMNGNLKINGSWELVREGETDGRYFRFIADSGASVTLDIGFNFFTHTLKNYIQDRIPDE